MCLGVVAQVSVRVCAGVYAYRSQVGGRWLGGSRGSLWTTIILHVGRDVSRGVSHSFAHISHKFRTFRAGCHTHFAHVSRTFRTCFAQSHRYHTSRRTHFVHISHTFHTYHKVVAGGAIGVEPWLSSLSGLSGPVRLCRVNRHHWKQRHR